MKDKLKIPYPVVVEGKYDRTRLLCVMQGQIITTDGFGVFNKPEKLALIRALAKKSKIIVLSDSDGAGKLIRSHITGAIPKDRLIQLYIPRIEGTEKRKKEPSKEGTLGVEGMEISLLYELLSPYADGTALERAESNRLSKADLYRDGLSGRPDSAALRDKFCDLIGLPPKMTANALLAAVKLLLSYDEYLETIKKIG